MRQLLARSGLKKWLGAISFVFLIISQLVWFVIVFRDPSSRLTDYHVYDVFGTAASRGLDPYALSLSEADSIARTRWGIGWQSLSVPSPSGSGNLLGFYYSPLFYLLFRPLTTFPPLPGAMVWYLASCVALDLSVLILSALRDRRLFDPLICVLAMFFAPVLQTLSGGQINAYLLLSLAIAFSGLEMKKPLLVGAGFGLSLLLKPLLAIFGLVGYLVWRRDFKSLGWTLFWLSTFFITSIPIVGLRAWSEYIFGVAAPTQGLITSGYVEGVSIWTFSNRMAPSGLAGALALSLSLGVVLVTAYHLWRYKELEGSSGASLVLVGLLLIAPGTWFHYLVLLIIPYAFLLRGFSPFPPNWQGSISKWLVIASFALLELHALTWKRFETQPYLSSWGTIGLGLLFGVLVFQALSPNSAGERLALANAIANADD